MPRDKAHGHVGRVPHTEEDGVLKPVVRHIHHDAVRAARGGGRDDSLAVRDVDNVHVGFVVKKAGGGRRLVGIVGSVAVVRGHNRNQKILGSNLRVERNYIDNLAHERVHVGTNGQHWRHHQQTTGVAAPSNVIHGGRHLACVVQPTGVDHVSHCDGHTREVFRAGCSAFDNEVDGDKGNG